jgi:hypothetical protein
VDSIQAASAPEYEPPLKTHGFCALETYSALEIEKSYCILRVTALVGVKGQVDRL